MKHFRVLLPLLVLALLLSGCAEKAQNPYSYTQGGNTVTVDPENGTITQGENVYTYTVEEGRNYTSYEIRYPNGGTYYWTTTEVSGVGGGNEAYDESEYLPGHLLVNALERPAPRQRHGNFVVGLMLIGLGAVGFFLPELPFYLRYGWAVENAVPSDAYITWSKIGGVLSAVLGLIYCIF